MTIRRSILAGAAGLAIAAVVPGGATLAQEGAFPTKPITIIVPFAPGGRTDTVARLLAQTIEENGFLEQPMVIVNIGGGAGAPAVAAMNAEPADGHTIVHWHHQALIAMAMGLGDFGLEDFESIGYTGGGSPVWTVHEDSEFETLEQLVDHLKANPRGLVEAVGIGSIPHLVGAMLAKEAGFETRYVTANSGSDRLRAVLGKNADIALFAASEYLAAEDLRALVYFGNSRLPEIPDVPTSAELGYATNWANPNWWLAKAGTPPEALEKLSAAFEQAMALPEIQEYFVANTLEPYWMAGPEAMADSAEILERLQVVAAEIQ